MSGRRVELNAFLSRQFVNWIEYSLQNHGVKKVIPDQDVLREAYAEAFGRQYVRAAIPSLKAEGYARLNATGIPEDLRQQVVAMVQKRANAPWDHAVTRLARRMVRSLE